MNQTEDNTLAEDIHIYPNPAKDILNISVSESFVKQNAQFELIDLTGKSLYKASLTEPVTNIDLARLNLLNAIYIVRISNATESRIIKLVYNN